MISVSPGNSRGVLNASLFCFIVITIVVTSVLTAPLLKFARLRRGEEDTIGDDESDADGGEGGNQACFPRAGIYC